MNNELNKEVVAVEDTDPANKELRESVVALTQAAEKHVLEDPAVQAYFADKKPQRINPGKLLFKGPAYDGFAFQGHENEVIWQDPATGIAAATPITTPLEKRMLELLYFYATTYPR